MKKSGKLKKLLFFVSLAFVAVQTPRRASANQATSYTYAADEDKK